MKKINYNQRPAYKSNITISNNSYIKGVSWARIFAHLSLIALAIFTSNQISTLLFTSPVAIFSLLAAARNRAPHFDAIDMYWLLINLFFFVGPAQSLGEGSILLFNNLSYIDYQIEHIITTFVIINYAAIVSYIFLPKSSNNGAIKSNLFLNSNILIIFILLSFLASIMLMGEFSNFLSSRRNRDWEIVSQFLPLAQGFQITSTILLLATLKKQKVNIWKNYIYISIAIITISLSFNPFNVARFYLIAAWIPIIYIYFPFIFKPLIFSFTTIISIIIIFPVLSITTRLGLDFEKLSNPLEGSISKIPYVDAFDTLLHAVYYADLYGYAFGKKIIAVIFFFIPRSLWPEKPIVSGLEIGYDIYNKGFFGTPNVSMNIMGDFYLDFGMIGVIILGAFLAFSFGKALSFSQAVNNINVYNLLIMASLPILARGSVGAVIALFFAMMVAYFFLTIITKRRDQE